MTSGGRGSFRTGEGLPFPRFISSSGTSQPDPPGSPVRRPSLRHPGAGTGYPAAPHARMQASLLSCRPKGPGTVRPSASRPPWTVGSGTASDGRFPLSRGNRPPPPYADGHVYCLFPLEYLPFQEGIRQVPHGLRCLDAALPHHDHPAAGPGPSCPSPGQHGVRARPSPPRIREPSPKRSLSLLPRRLHEADPRPRHRRPFLCPARQCGRQCPLSGRARRRSGPVPFRGPFLPGL